LLVVFLELFALVLVVNVDDEVVALPSLINSNLLGEIFLPSFLRLDVNDGVVVVVDDDDGDEV
jgi:hypothetical protein